MSHKSKTRTLLAGLLVAVAAASVAFLAPSASAHTCAAYDGCDAGACKDGEDHDHTDYNYVQKDEHCSSKKAPPTGSCEYNDIELPGIVCELIEPEGAISIRNLDGLLDGLP